MDFVRTFSMHIAKVAGLDTIWITSKEDRSLSLLKRLIGRGCAAVTLSCPITGPPPIPSFSVDSNLLSTPTSGPVPPSVFYSQLTPNRPVTPPPNASIPTGTPIHLTTTALPPRHMTEILPNTILRRRPVVRSLARCHPNNS